MTVYFPKYPNRIGIITGQNDQRYKVLYTDGKGIHSEWVDSNEILFTNKSNSK